MRRTCLALSCLLALCARGGASAHPNDSIAPEKPKPTPYGFQITRSQDVHPRHVGPWVEDRPDAQAHYLQVVRDSELSGGAYNTALAEPLQALARSYQARGKHSDAVETFQRALHLLRINEGLYNPAQLALLGELIDSHLALGDLDAADHLYSWRFRVQQNILPPDSPEMQAAIADYVEWQRQAYLQGITGVAEEGFRRLLDMYQVYTKQIERLEAAGNAVDAEREALYKRLQVEYLISQYDGEKAPAVQLNISGFGGTRDELSASTSLEAEQFRQLREYNLRNGINTAKRLKRLADEAESPDPLEQARARLAAGDWYQWSNMTARARQNYEEAWNILSRHAGSGVDPDTLFPKPVELPDTRIFHPDGVSPTEDVSARAVVSLVVSREGRARDIEIVEQDPPMDMGARVVLFRLLREVRFRPLVRDGQVTASTDIRREYRYQY